MHFEIAYKWMFLLLPLPLVFYLLLPPFRKKRMAMIVPFFSRVVSLSAVKARRRAWVGKRSFFAWLCLVLSWICLLGAAASPRYVGQPGKRIVTARSFLIVADISFSMAETDWVLNGRRSSRWEAVKAIMKDFVQQRKSDRVGLILFASHAYLQAPLTNDLDAVTWLLDQSEVGMAGQMTGIGEAIAYGVKVFKKDTIKHKVMLLLTDGIDGGQNILPLDAAQAAKKDSVLIYTLGIGKARGSGGYDLDERALKEIAAATGGRYFNAMNEGQLKKVYSELDRIEPVKYEEADYKPIRLLYMYPLAAAVGLGFLFAVLNSLYKLITGGS